MKNDSPIIEFMALPQRIIPCLLCFVTLLGVSSAPATVYDLAIEGDLYGRSLRLNIPDTVSTARGIVIWGNGASSDNRGRATEAELVAFAESIGFVVLGCAQWGNFWYDGDREMALFETAISQLAMMSGHAELNVVPLLPIGHSNGGLMSYGINNLRTAKVVSMLLSKAGAYTESRPADFVLRTPGLLVAGELDDVIRIEAIRDRFFGNRPRGALWSWVEEEGMNHSEGNSPELIRPFIEATIRLRYPASSAAGTAVTLIPMIEQDGWLTDPDSYKTGLADIASYGSYTKDKSRAGWLPNRRIAYIFRAFASYNKATSSATLLPGVGPVDWGTRLSYTLSAPRAPWTRIDFYEGDVWLKNTTPADVDALTVSMLPRVPGYSVFHALVTFADGTQRTTKPRRAWVRAGASQAPVFLQHPGHQTLIAGHDALFSVVASSPVKLSYRWQRSTDGGVSWSSLSDGGVYGSTATETLMVHAPSAQMSGDLFRCVLSNSSGSDVTSNSAELLLGVVPSILVQPASIAVGQGAKIVFSVVVSDAGSLSFQWQKNGVNIAGATDAKWVFNGVTLEDAGSYSVRVSNDVGSVLSGAAVLSVDSNAFVPPASSLKGISSRSQVGVGDSIMIAGFVIGDGGSKTILIRASGPALGAMTQGQLSGVLENPILELVKIGGPMLATNDDWGGDSGVAEAAKSLGLYPFGTSSKDAAMIVTLPPGAYSVIVRGLNEGTGLALVEVYDLDQAAASRLISLATRAFVGTGDQLLIAGLSISGSSTCRVLTRAVGPFLGTLTNGQLTGLLPDPQLAMVRLGGERLSANDNWEDSDGAAVVATSNRLGAFPLVSGSKDSAILAALPAGLYTPQVTDRNGATGIALVEVYEAN